MAAQPADPMAQGEATGRAEGKAEARRADLLRLLELRFSGPVTAEVTAAIEAQADPERLARWFDAAATAPSWEAFRAASGI